MDSVRIFEKGQTKIGYWELFFLKTTQNIYFTTFLTASKWGCFCLDGMNIGEISMLGAHLALVLFFFLK